MPYLLNFFSKLSDSTGVGVFFPFFILESSECFWVKTGAMVHFLGPLGGLVWSSGTSAVLRIKIEKIAFVRL